MAESNTNKELNWSDKSKEQTKTRMKIGSEKENKWRLPRGTYIPPGSRKEGEEERCIVYYLAILHPIRYCKHAIPMERQQLQQQQHPREKRKIVVLLSFLLFSLDNTLFIAPNIHAHHWSLTNIQIYYYYYLLHVLNTISFTTINNNRVNRQQL